MPSDETIIAIATPPGRGGLGVVRLSGPRAVEIASSLINLSSPHLEIQRATLGEFTPAEPGRALDQVIVTHFRAPHSYTGEDVIEISCHGSPVILRYLVECCLSRGARAAEPGEFTLRAFLNGRIDLTQAEAVRDLIDSQTLYQARVAAQQLTGSVSARLKPHKQVLLNLIARLEAGIDFAEDDVAVSDWSEISAELERIRADLEKLLAGYDYGRIVREGLTLAIVGRPNVGKSSLFNRLLNEDRAIVTPIPGTTRDLVAETANLGGIPLRFIDTAGVRETLDQVERIGVERTFAAIADSDLRVMVVDASQPWTPEDSVLTQKLLPLGSLVVVLNKSDLPSQIPDSSFDFELGNGRLTLRGGRSREGLTSHAGDAVGAPHEMVRTSALTGDGIEDLRETILKIAAPARDLGPEGELITNVRHQQLIKDSLDGLSKAQKAAEDCIPHEMLLIDLYDALRPLDTITGATYADDLLDIIFKTFCVGK